MEMEAQQQENDDEIADDYRINGTNNGTNASGDGNASTMVSANADTDDVNAATDGSVTSTATSTSSACLNSTGAAMTTDTQRTDGNCRILYVRTVR